MEVFQFEKLIAWKKAKELTLAVYPLVASSPNTSNMPSVAK